MKKTLLLLLVTACIAGCQKKTVNNYLNGSAQPAFALNGINDLVLVNEVTYEASLPLTIQYLDSAQENVVLAIAGLPAGITMDTTWVHSGIPTFSTTLTIFDTSATSVTPGIYPVKLIATTASGYVKTYPFNIKVQAMPTGFLGTYNNCTSFCGAGGTYTDSLYVDAAVPNKVWFANFANSGNKVYALITISETLTIPTQTVGGVTYASYNNSGTILDLTNHQMNLQITENSGVCSFRMQ